MPEREKYKTVTLYGMHLAKVPSLRDENCWPLCAITLAPLFLGAVWHGYTQLPSFYYNEQKRIREINNNSSSEVMLIRIRKMEEHIGPSDIPPPSQSMLCSVRVTLQNKNNKKKRKTSSPFLFSTKTS